MVVFMYSLRCRVVLSLCLHWKWSHVACNMESLRARCSLKARDGSDWKRYNSNSSLIWWQAAREESSHRCWQISEESGGGGKKRTGWKKVVCNTGDPGVLSAGGESHREEKTHMEPSASREWHTTLLPTAA